MVGITQTKPIILASVSPLRSELLLSAEVSFDVVPSPYDEDIHKAEIAHLPIPEQAVFLACGKALAVSVLYPDHIVIAADQMGAFNNTPLFKPGTRDDAIAMLMAMQGQTHYQHCAACIYAGGNKLASFIDSVTMNMRTLTREEIIAYVNMDDPLACCGSYRYEGLGKYLFSSIEGCYESVLGLPLLDVLNFLQDTKVLHL